MLAEEDARGMTVHPQPSNRSLVFPTIPASIDATPLPIHRPFPHSLITPAITSFSNSNNNDQHGFQDMVLKREVQSPLVARDAVPGWFADKGGLDFPSSLFQSYYPESHQTLPPSPPPVVPLPAHISATALLQKAAQLGTTVSRCPSHPSLMAGHNNPSASAKGSANFAIGLPPPHHDMGFANGSFFQMGRALGGQDHGKASGASHGRGEEGGNPGFTRDFLGLTMFSTRDMLNMPGMETCIGASSPFEEKRKKPW